MAASDEATTVESKRPIATALSEVATNVTEAQSIHHGSLAPGDEVTLHHAPGAIWLCVDGVVQVSATYA